MEIKKISIIGGGTMGSGIATLFAMYGFDVAILEISESLCQRSMITIETNNTKLLQKEKISKSNYLEIKRNISFISGINSIDRNSDLIIEAINENKEQKLKLFRELDTIVKRDAIFASNTSSISITELAQSGRPENFMGIHFMNPVPLMKLVELINGYRTSAETYEIVYNLILKIEKTPISVNDSPGFISNRILIPFINEAIFALYEGIATKEAIDSVAKLGFNHPMGPLSLADYIGLDVCLNIMEVLYDEFQDSKYRACPILKKMVAAGKLGKKTGEGFYKY